MWIRAGIGDVFHESDHELDVFARLSAHTCTCHCTHFSTCTLIGLIGALILQPILCSFVQEAEALLPALCDKAAHASGHGP